MKQRADVALDGRLAGIPSGDRVARWLAALCVVASSAGCILTKDLPDPALDIPQGYKAERVTRRDTPPTLDWWRGFRSPELTSLMEEAQTVNLDIAAATARFIQADAQARVAGAALLPSLSGTGQQNYARTSGSSASGLTNGGRKSSTTSLRSAPAMSSISGARTATPRRRRRKLPLLPGSIAMWWR